MTKLREHGVIMTDSCNAAQKARRLLQHQIGGDVFEMDCHHHLRNVWIKGMEKSVSVFLRVVVSDSLEQILGSGEKELRWCQGKVIKVLPEAKRPTVVVRWDPMPDVEGKENVSEETQQVLRQRLWNKNVEGAWRMDINVGIVEDTEEDEGVWFVGSYLNDDSKGEGSDSKCSETDTSDGDEDKSDNSNSSR